MEHEPWSSAKALKWLRDERDRGTHEWRGLCAGLCAHAFGYGGAGNNANAWGRRIPASIRRYGVAPAGMIEIWLGGEYGHIGYSLGHGVLLCNTPDGSVGRMQSSYYGKIGPSFWVDPRYHHEKIFGACFGVNTDKVVMPHKNTNPVVARPGEISNAVLTMRKIFGSKSKNKRMGRIMTNKVKKWQRAHKLAPNAIITKNQLALFVKTKGK